LKRGELPIYEPDLAELLSDAAVRGGISFTTDFEPTVTELVEKFESAPLE